MGPWKCERGGLRLHLAFRSISVPPLTSPFFLFFERPPPPLLFFCPLPRPLFQHPITASACCLSCGVHGWKWLGTSNHWRGEKGREVKETERERLTSIFGRKNANIINEHNEGWWPLNVPSDFFFANAHTSRCVCTRQDVCATLGAKQ